MTADTKGLNKTIWEAKKAIAQLRDIVKWLCLSLILYKAIEKPGSVQLIILEGYWTDKSK